MSIHSHSHSSGSSADHSDSLTTDEKNRLQRLLLKAYSNLVGPDNIHGVTAIGSNLMPTVVTYAHANDWQQALPAYDTMINSSLQSHTTAATVTTMQSRIAHTLRHLNLDHVLNSYIQGVSNTSGVIRSSNVNSTALPDTLRELQFESSWRMYQWDASLFSTTGSSSSSSGNIMHDISVVRDDALATAVDLTADDITDSNVDHFNECVYRALMSIRQRDSSVFETSLKDIRQGVLSALSSGLSYEGGKELYPCMIQLQCAVELDELRSLIVAKQATGGTSDTALAAAAPSTRGKIMYTYVR
jgi:hypothetical protein